jgi:hypothetical protein
VPLNSEVVTRLAVRNSPARNGVSELFERQAVAERILLLIDNLSTEAELARISTIESIDRRPREYRLRIPAT